MGKAAVIIAAAGSGRRMGTDRNKVLMPLAGIPVLVHSMQKFISQDWIQEMIVVTRGEDYKEVQEMIAGWGLTLAQVVIGGKDRQDSVALGLQAVSQDIDWIFIHDGARPLIKAEVIAEAYYQVQKYKAVGVAVPVTNTIKVANQDQIVDHTPNRSSLWAMQTPQVFASSVIKKAYHLAEINGWTATDDCSLVEQAGFPVRLVAGSYSNIKITTREDFHLAAILLDARTEGSKVGFGYDVHRLEEGRRLVLGGITIDYPLGLAGHSDADVVTHALMDSLLGAAGLGDIGRHFPDTDAAYKDISSLKLLGQVMAKLEVLGYRVNNIDLTIVAQRPKLAPYFEQMRVLLAQTINVNPSRINIKATTTEGLGFCGREEGIAAYSSATIIQL